MQEQVLVKENNTDSKVTTIDLRLHTIIMTIGPSGCGKTHFIENKIIPEIKKHDGVKVAHVNSDNIRRELLGDMSLSKKDMKMMYASKQAFSLLDAKVRALTSYPINTDFVIVDSTGLSADFRKNIKEIASENNYNLVVLMFDYKGRQMYYDYITEEESRAVTSRQIDFMRENVMSQVNKSTYPDIVKVKNRELNDYVINLTNYKEYQECILPSEYDYVIIGDVHGCYEELVLLLEKNGFQIKDGKITHEESRKRILFVGDLVDKGYDVRGVIELVHNNLDIIYMVKGNHENFVYKYVKGLTDPKRLPPQEVIDVYFDSEKLFKSDELLKQKFFEVVEKMKPFFKHEDFVVTHTPCDDKYIAKLGSIAERAQHSIVYPKEVDYAGNPQAYEEALYEYFKPFRAQASRSYPFHVFGHVSTKGIAKLYNKINIDTGAVGGGHLTSIIINNNGRHAIAKVSSAANERVKKKELKEFFFTMPQKISIETLEGHDKGRVLSAAENKVNFISGTICPADKMVKKDEDKKIILEESTLESLQQGIFYFKNKGIHKLIAQPKYMGSRANIYLFKDPSKNYTVSRGGFVVKPERLDLTEAYKPLYELPYVKEAFSKNTELLILDAELLPWSAIGKGLIEKSFVTVDKAISSEIEFLKRTGFEEIFGDVLESDNYKDFIKTHSKVSKEELSKKFGANNEKTFRSIKDYVREHVSLDEIAELAKVYTHQIKLYGSDGEAYFKPFSILKEVFEDGSEKLFFDESNEEIYKGVNSDEYLVVDINNEEDIQKLKDFYEKTTIVQEMEGIMLKPIQVYIKEVVPALKIRNSRYLTIVYGPDYQMPFKLNKLMEKKKINRKLEVSIKEWEIGKRMLEIPYNKIEKQNPYYIQAAGEMVIEEKNEKELDPRL